jgi:hypothetical protein
MHEILTEANQSTPHASRGQHALHAAIGSFQNLARVYCATVVRKYSLPCLLSSLVGIYVRMFPTFFDMNVFTVHSQLQSAASSRSFVTTNPIPLTRL